MDELDRKFALAHLNTVRRDTLEGQVAYIRQANRQLLASDLRRLGSNPYFNQASEDRQARAIRQLALARGHIRG